MDAVAWALLVGAVAVTAVVIAVSSRASRDVMRKRATSGGFGGIGGGMDAVWRPTAEDAHAQWEAQVELPAPAPTPGDKDHLSDTPFTVQL